MTDLRGSNAPQEIRSDGSGVIVAAIVVLLGIALFAGYSFATTIMS